jgi:hypothetical protein
MPINIKMKVGFMYWGLTSSSLTLSVPYPTSGTFETSRKAQTQESADGSIVAQVIGRSRDKQTLSWDVMDCTKWWEINQWLETNGMFFYCRYFNFNRGVWQTRKFYAESPSCEPYKPCSNQQSQSYGMPRFLTNCSLTVIDMGSET